MHLHSRWLSCSSTTWKMLTPFNSWQTALRSKWTFWYKSYRFYWSLSYWFWKDKSANVDEVELKLDALIKLHFGYKSKKLRVNISLPMKIEQKREQETIYKHWGRSQAADPGGYCENNENGKVVKHQQLLGEVVTQLSSIFQASDLSD